MDRSRQGEYVCFDAEPEGLVDELSHPLRLFEPYWTHRRLIGQLAWREWARRHRGSFLGGLWTLAHPLLTLGVYALVLGGVLRVRWPVAGGATGAHFALLLFAGIVPFGFLGESLGRAADWITGNPAYVKRMVFPLEILPMVGLLANGVQALVGTMLLVLGAWGLGRLDPALSFWLIPLWALTALFVFWTSTIAAVLGVFVRDLTQALPVITQLLFFGAPVFYPMSMVPAGWRPLVELNPMTPIVTALRGILLEGRSPDGHALLLWAAFHLLATVLAVLVFRRGRSAFVDVL